MSNTSDEVQAVTVPISIGATVVAALFLFSSCQEKVTAHEAQIKIEAIKAGLVQGRDGWTNPVAPTQPQKVPEVR